METFHVGSLQINNKNNNTNKKKKAKKKSIFVQQLFIQQRNPLKIRFSINRASIPPTRSQNVHRTNQLLPISISLVIHKTPS